MILLRIAELHTRSSANKMRICYKNRKQDYHMSVNFPNGTSAISIESGTYHPAPGILPIPATVFKTADMQRTLIGLSDL